MLFGCVADVIMLDTGGVYNSFMAGEKDLPKSRESTVKKVWAVVHGNGGTEIKEENLWIVDPVAYIRIQIAKLLHPQKKVSDDEN